MALAARVASALAGLSAVVAPPPPRKRGRDDEGPAQPTAPVAGSATALAAAPASRPAPARPWSREDYWARLATFSSPLSWFGRPEAIGPAQCASLGWQLEAPDKLGCATCGASLVFSASSATGMGADSLAALAGDLRARLGTAHAADCPWRGGGVPPHFATVAPPTAGGERALAASVRDGAMALAPLRGLLAIDAATPPAVVQDAAWHAKRLASAVVAAGSSAPAVGGAGTSADEKAAAIVRSVLAAVGAAVETSSAADAGGGAGVGAAAGGAPAHVHYERAAEVALGAPASAPAVAALFGWALVAQQSGVPPQLQCAHCGKCAALHPRAPMMGAGANTARAPTAAAAAPAAASGAGSRGGGHADSMGRLVRSASAAAQRALATLRAAHAPAGSDLSSAAAPASGYKRARLSLEGGGESGNAMVISPAADTPGPQSAGEDGGSGGGFRADPPAPALAPSAALTPFDPLRSHAWYCPIVRPGCSLPPALVAALLGAGGGGPSHSPTATTAAAAGAAVSAALATLSTAVLGVSDAPMGGEGGGGPAGGSRGGGGVAAGGWEPAVGVPGWLLLMLAAGAGARV